MDTWQCGCFGKMDNLPVHTRPLPYLLLHLLCNVLCTVYSIYAAFSSGKNSLKIEQKQQKRRGKPAVTQRQAINSIRANLRSIVFIIIIIIIIIIIYYYR